MTLTSIVGSMSAASLAARATPALRRLMFGVAIGLCIAAGAAEARAGEMRSLVVAVSEYPTLDKRYQLEGPHNDAVRLREVLLARGFAADRITVLADQVPDAAGLPTRANILAALEGLAQQAGADDFVMLYFAGHGSQQPTDRSRPESRDETDGLDEIFLPRDVGRFSEGGDGKPGTVENALVDYELRAAVDKISAKGAFVWGVFDACHSATLVRGAEPDPEVRYRFVPSDALGIQDAAIDKAQHDAATAAVTATTTATAATAPRDTTTSGSAATLLAPVNLPAAADTGAGLGSTTPRSVFFYATQTRELAPEMRLPAGAPDRRPYGLFGFTVTQALQSGVPMTYRQLGQYVLTQYGAMNESRVTPLFSGTALDTPVLMQRAPIVQQWRVTRSGNDLTVQAGALSRIDAGAVLAIVASPIARDDEAIGFVKAGKVALTSTDVVTVAHAGKPALTTADIPDGAYARLVNRAPQYGLRVSVDGAARGDAAALYLAAVDLLRHRGVDGARIEWLEAPASGDVKLKLVGDHVALLPPSGQAGSAQGTLSGASAVALGDLPSATAPGGQTSASAGDRTVERAAERIGTALHGVARAVNLMRIAGQLQAPATSTSAARPGGGLDVRLTLTGHGGPPRPFTIDKVPLLLAGDKVNVSLANSGRMAIDCTMLYLDARYGVGVLFPQTPGASNRLEPGDTTEFAVDINDETTGIERILTIAVEAALHEERADFSFLAQPPLEHAREVREGRTRGAGESDAMAAFRDAGFADYTTRGGARAPAAPTSRTSMQVFTLNVSK